MRITDCSSDVCSSDLMLPLMAGKGDPKIARIKAWVVLMAKKEYAVGEGLTEIFTQLMAYNMKKKSNRDDLIDSCAYGQQMIDNYLGIIMEQARGYQNFEETAKSGLEVANVGEDDSRQFPASQTNGMSIPAPVSKRKE